MINTTDASGGKSMDVRKCYEVIEGDYEDVKRRFLSDARIRRFALLFLKDDSMANLREAIREEDSEKAFHAAHTLKGVCLNLGLTGLYSPVNRITELLRAGKFEEALLVMPSVEQAYKVTYEGLEELAQS